MYLPFLMLGYTGALIVVLIGCVLARRAVSSLKGLRELTGSVMLAIAAVVLVGLRPWAPAFFSVFIGNCSLMACYVLLYRAAARVLGKWAGATPWLAALCMAMLVPFGAFVFIIPDVTSRIVLVSFTLASASTVTTALLLNAETRALAGSSRAVSGVQALSGAVLIARGVVTLMKPPQNFVAGDWLQTFFTYGQLLTYTASVCGILWLAICRHQDELEQMAMSDSLTGLLNRRSFDEILGREMSRSTITGKQFGLALVDVDHFKAVNDTFGHSIGDQVIRTVAKTLKDSVRPGDSLARYGGEEFAIVVRHASADQVEGVAERIRANIEQTAFGPEILRLTVSVGLVMSDSASNVTALFDACDKALYEAKRSGRNRAVWYQAQAASLLD